MNSENPVERHPWPPFVPDGCKVLIMGTFPPGEHRWSMPFFYPNPTNDFWPMMGLLYFGNKEALRAPGGRGFNLEAIKKLLVQHRIGLTDTGVRIRRLKGNASDKFLEIIEPINLAALLAAHPGITDVCSTGLKAAEVLAVQTDTAVPKVGEYAVGASGLRVWRMPSTSRAYPLALAKKAEFYAKILPDL